MGTNFYMFTKKKELAPFFGSKLKIVDEPDFGYMIHIGKVSAGREPLFEAHDHIRSVADLKLLYDKGNVQIYDEYDKEYTWDGFVKRVAEFGDEHNWRTGRNNDSFSDASLNEFISIDGYRFSEDRFS